MAEDQDQEQKTEQPTYKRLEEAFKKGNIPNSREVNNFLTLVVLAITIGWFGPAILHNTQVMLIPFLADADSIAADTKGIGIILNRLIWDSVAIISGPLICVVIVGLAGRFLQSGFVISSEPLMPKWSKISPMAGIKRLFSSRSVVELVKSMLKMTIVGVVAYSAVSDQLTHLQQLPNSTTVSLLHFLMKLSIDMVIGVLIAMFFIALLDLLYQRFQYFKSLRMSKQEIKDEYKQSEGDPLIKQKLRQLRRERAMNRMMQAVPEADVVITNPTHYAVALQYDVKAMKAPTVVAKGQDLIALRIRDVAKENDVPVIENPPLARALFSSTDIDEEIPMAHYEAVAKIISYVYQLKGKKI